MLKNNRVFVIITTVIILLPILAGLVIWKSLPAEMPVHWNARGEIDGYASRAFCVFGMPIIMAALHWVCIIATSLDHRNNNQNSKAAYIVLLIIPIISLITCGAIYSASLGFDPNVETVLPIILGIMFMIIGNYMPKFRRNSTMGVRIPWTVRSDENWNCTHRFTGPLYMIGGAIITISAFTNSVIPIVAAIIIMVIVPILYSCIYYVRHEK